MARLGCLRDRVTVIITTSPVRSNPDTFVISAVIQSFLLVPGLADCRKLIMCDHYVVAEEAR
jgi:hypothetical protein